MTRGMVKSKLMHERKWAICNQTPKWSAVHRLNVDWLAPLSFKNNASLRYSQTSPERVQNNNKRHKPAQFYTRL